MFVYKHDSSTFASKNEKHLKNIISDLYRVKTLTEQKL